MYDYDQEYGFESNGTAMCNHIENPMEIYKYKEPEPITCDEDELGLFEFEICKVDLKVQQGELTEEEAEFEYCLIEEEGDEKKCLPAVEY
jgi:hypothetical protein